MTHATAEKLPFAAIGIVGCGLIGCSIAAALKQRGFQGQVVGCGRPGNNLETAAARGYVDSAVSDPGRLAASCDLVVVATPVNRIVEDVLAAALACRPETVITDTGSVKQVICDALASAVGPSATFIGSHPIAGSEKQGCAHASAELLDRRVCVMTPPPAMPRPPVDRLAAFWRFLGMTVVEMSPADHDRALAQTSHVPHVVASALAATLADENRRLTAGGYYDTTRIASGDPELWAAILLSNAAESAAGLRAVSDRLNDFLQALANRDEQTLLRLLHFGKTNREKSVGNQL